MPPFLRHTANIDDGVVTGVADFFARYGLSGIWYNIQDAASVRNGLFQANVGGAVDAIRSTGNTDADLEASGKTVEPTLQVRHGVRAIQLDGVDDVMAVAGGHPGAYAHASDKLLLVAFEKTNGLGAVGLSSSGGLPTAGQLAIGADQNNALSYEFSGNDGTDIAGTHGDAAQGQITIGCIQLRDRMASIWNGEEFLQMGSWNVTQAERTQMRIGIDANGASFMQGYFYEVLCIPHNVSTKNATAMIRDVQQRLGI